MTVLALLVLEHITKTLMDIYEWDFGGLWSHALDSLGKAWCSYREQGVPFVIFLYPFIRSYAI